MRGRPRPDAKVLAVLLALSGCAGAPSPEEAPLTLSVPPEGFPRVAIDPVSPPGSALAEARARLGRRLFFDPQLSRTGLVSCATCHPPANAFADPHPVSAGVDGRLGHRNAPSLVNLVWTSSFFWDGRETTLEAQVTAPLANPDEMDLPIAEAIRRLDADPTYRRAFLLAFDLPASEDGLRRALALFIRTLVSGQSPYDQFLRGDAGALTPGARRGKDLFFTERAACFHCHPAGPLTNDGFFNNGSHVLGGDVGRSAVTGRTGDLGKFKVPGLRNVAATAPYMHDGSLATLDAVVDHYVTGGRGGPNTDAVIMPLTLSAADKADLVEFLHALTDAAFVARFLADARQRD